MHIHVIAYTLVSEIRVFRKWFQIRVELTHPENAFGMFGLLLWASVGFFLHNNLHWSTILEWKLWIVTSPDFFLFILIHLWSRVLYFNFLVITIAIWNVFNNITPTLSVVTPFDRICYDRVDYAYTTDLHWIVFTRLHIIFNGVFINLHNKITTFTEIYASINQN